MNELNYISSEMIKTESIFKETVFIIAVICCLYFTILIIETLLRKYIKLHYIVVIITITSYLLLLFNILACGVLDKPSGYYRYTVSMNEYFKLVNTDRIEKYRVIKQNKDGTFVITDDPSYRN